MPVNSRTEDAEKVVYAVYGVGETDPSYVTIYKTTPASYTIQPSAQQIMESWQEICASTDAALGIEGAS